MLRCSARLLALAGLSWLGGCAREAPPAPPVDRDPVVAAALADPLLVDGDLVGQNQQDAVLGLAGPAAAPVPPIDRSDEAIAAARAEAAQLLGGPPAPAPQGRTAAPGLPRTTARQAARAALRGGPAQACADRLGYGLIWAARLPADLPVYPRGHAQEAAGSDAPGCRVRVVHFLTPVPANEVVDFYWARAHAAGFVAELRSEGDDRVVSGRRGAAAFAVYVSGSAGPSAVDLITSE